MQVASLLAEADGSAFRNSFISIKAEYQGEPPDYGAAYLYALQDTVSNTSHFFLSFFRSFISMLAWLPQVTLEPQTLDTSLSLEGSPPV